MKGSTEVGATLARELDLANRVFHAAYADARSATAQSTPVFVVLADDLIVFCRGERHAFRFTSALYHAIKAGAHVSIALYAMLQRGADRDLEPPTRDRLVSLQSHLRVSLDALPHDLANADEEIVSDLRATLASCVHRMEGVLAAGRADSHALRGFAREARSTLLRLTHHATRIQIDALHETVERALALLSAEHRRELHVVVAGDHQARDRSLGLQYFQRRPQEHGPVDERVLYAEHVTTEEEALSLVGTLRLDRAIASACFGDPARLQRDVLGDATLARLDALGLPPIR